MFYMIGSALFRALEKAHIKEKEAKYKRRYSIDSTFDLKRSHVRFYGKGDIIGGAESYVGHNTAIQAMLGYTVKIGRRTRISHNVRMYTSSTETQQDFTQRPLKSYFGNIDIGEGVWIGANTVILPGVTIGSNVAIGANSVVTKDIPSNTVYGGVPARFIKNK